MRKITFQSIGEVQGSQVWRNRETGVEIIKGANFGEVGLYYICTPTQDEAGRTVVSTASKLADARIEAIRYAEMVRTEIAEAYDDAMKIKDVTITKTPAGRRIEHADGRVVELISTPAEADPKALALVQREPVNGDPVEWTGSADAVGYVTDVQDNRVSVAWTNRETGKTGVDAPAFVDFHKDWRIVETPTIEDATGEPAIDETVASKTPARYRVVLFRIGRRGRQDLGEITIPATSAQPSQDVAFEIHKRVRSRHLLSSPWFEVEADLEAGTVRVEGGRFGVGTVTRA